MKIKCPACSTVLSVPDSAAGKVVKCRCGKQLRAPGGTAAAKPSRAGQSASRPAGQTATAGAARGAAARRPKGTASDFDAAMLDELTDTDLRPVKTVGSPSRATAASSNTGSKLLQQYASTNDAKASVLLGPKIDGEIAGVGRRIGGALLDGVFHMLFIGVGIGIMFAMVAGAGEEGPDAGTLNTANFIVIGSAILPAIINAALISMSGQTVGKKIVGTVIVSQGTGAPVGFGQGFLIRNVGFGFFTGIPILGLFVALADIVYLFLEDHITLHDKLANTMVVLK